MALASSCFVFYLVLIVPFMSFRLLCHEVEDSKLMFPQLSKRLSGKVEVEKERDGPKGTGKVLPV